MWMPERKREACTQASASGVGRVAAEQGCCAVLGFFGHTLFAGGFQRLFLQLLLRIHTFAHDLHL